jgi:hypothetical protein
MHAPIPLPPSPRGGAGPAQMCGLVKVGDILYEVDGKTVFRVPLTEISAYLLV